MFDKGEQGDYGFFCDLENAKTMDYDKVEYYVVTTQTHYEVKRKSIGNKTMKTQPVRISSTERITEYYSDSSRVNMPKLTEEYSVESKNTNKSIFRKLANLPREAYYSLMVCITSASCVYFVMTYSCNSSTS
jgi:hypothetical protein